MTKSYILLLISSVFIIITAIVSCSSQTNSNALVNTEVNPAEQDKTSQSVLGETVSTLDAQTWHIYQDQENNYWFGSNGRGVFFYDGDKLTKYTTKDGLIDNTIRSIKGDHLGNVFIGTPEGVSKFDGNSFTTLQLDKTKSNNWKIEPKDLWFNCNGNHLYRYDGENLYDLELPQQDLKKAFGIDVKGVPFEGMNNSPYAVYGIDKDRAGNMWFGTVTAGAYRYDGESFLWFSEMELSVLPDGRAPGVRSMIQDKDGYYWLSNFKSKYRVNGKGLEAKYEKFQGIDISEGYFKDRLPYFNSGLVTNNGDLWMTTYSSNVWKYDGDKLHHLEINGGETEVLSISIYEDNSGVLWIGTNNMGVFKYNGSEFERFEP